MKVVKSNKGQPTVSFIGSIFTIGFGILWTMMVHHFISIVGGLGPMGIMFPLIGIFFITVGIIQVTIYLTNVNRNDFNVTDADYLRKSFPQKYWGDSKDDIKHDAKHNVKHNVKHVNCRYCNTSFDENFAYCPKCGKSKSD